MPYQPAPATEEVPWNPDMHVSHGFAGSFEFAVSPLVQAQRERAAYLKLLQQRENHHYRLTQGMFPTSSFQDIYASTNRAPESNAIASTASAVLKFQDSQRACRRRASQHDAALLTALRSENQPQLVLQPQTVLMNQISGTRRKANGAPLDASSHLWQHLSTTPSSSCDSSSSFTNLHMQEFASSSTYGCSVPRKRQRVQEHPTLSASSAQASYRAVSLQPGAVLLSNYVQQYSAAAYPSCQQPTLMVAAQSQPLHTDQFQHHLQQGNWKADRQHHADAYDGVHQDASQYPRQAALDRRLHAQPQENVYHVMVPAVAQAAVVTSTDALRLALSVLCSADQSLSATAAWTSAHGLALPIRSDAYTSTSNQYHAHPSHYVTSVDPKLGVLTQVPAPAHRSPYPGNTSKLELQRAAIASVTAGAATQQPARHVTMCSRDGGFPTDPSLRWLCQLGWLAEVKQSVTVKLAYHLWGRLAPQLLLLHKLHQGSAQAVGPLAVCLRIAAKLEEKRRDVVSVSRFSTHVGLTVEHINQLEVQVMQLLDWRPYAGFLEL